ncbi:MAG: 2-dehydropantoate 2-reductase N-terminal domain-containing protein [Burkholderiales bacterium]|nr:2-dehydropantoate 2-reductase N-terminal domain-containing protein [Burkholderiales bacterium]
MEKKIAVLGAGAIGSSVSADLIRAGLNVTVIDQWPAHVEAMKAGGLHVKLKDGDLHFPVRALHLCDLASARLEFDIVLLAAKSNDARWMAEFIKPYLKRDGVLVGVQNGMNDDAIAAIVGRNRALGCVVELQAELFTPGLIQRNTTHQGTWFAVGELDGAYTPRVREIADIMGNVGRCDVTNNIYGAKWTKLIANTMTMGPFGLLGLRNFEAAALHGMFDISVKLGKESFAVGAALGYRVEPVFGLRADEFAGSSDENLVTAMQTLMSHVGGGRTAPIHDHIKGRRSEIEFISGLVAKQGRELGIATPFNDAVTEIDRRINSGEIRMDLSNYERLKALIVTRQQSADG